MPRFKLTLKCHVCTHRWRRIVKTLDAPDPPCPRCTAAQRTIGMDYTSNRAPAAVGMSNVTKAIDTTAEIVMQDHGMTDLRDNVRVGETMAPKLHPRQQAMADNFFTKGRGQKKPLISPQRMGQLGQLALAGAFSPAATGGRDPVQPLHAAQFKPPIRIVNER